MNDPHARFSAWLMAGAHGEPPRDLALHASVCMECSSAIASFDLLSQIDPGRATMPFWEGAYEEPGGLLRAGRFAAAATGVMLVAVVTGVGVSGLIAGTRAPKGVALASETPQQGVLGGSGTPGASPGSATPSASLASLSASPSTEPLGTPFTLPTAWPTPRPTAAPTRSPMPTPTASPTPKSTSTPSPTPTPTGTPTPTDTPTPTETPTPTPTDTPTPSPAASL